METNKRIQGLIKKLQNQEDWQKTLNFVFPCGKTGQYLIYESPVDDCKWCAFLSWMIKEVFKLEDTSSFNGVSDCCDYYATSLERKRISNKAFSRFIFRKYVEYTKFGMKEIERQRSRRSQKVNVEEKPKTLYKKPKERRKPEWLNLRK